MSSSMMIKGVLVSFLLWLAWWSPNAWIGTSIPNT
ncbi:hypothetical protein LINPERPRIM_LOCUS30006 [Linum perenne]